MSGAWLRQILILLLALVLDEKLAPELAVFGVHPDLVVPAVLFTTMRFGPGAGAWTGFTAGLFIDVATPEHLGARALALAVAAFATGRLALHVDVGTLPVQLVLLAVLGTLDATIYQAASHFTEPGRGVVLLVTRLLPTVLYTVLLLVPFLLVWGRRLVPARARWREGT